MTQASAGSETRPHEKAEKQTHASSHDPRSLFSPSLHLRRHLHFLAEVGNTKRNPQGTILSRASTYSLLQ